MKNKHKIGLILVLFAAIVIWLIAFSEIPLNLRRPVVALLQPKGVVSSQQKTLIIESVLLMLLIVAPVLAAAFFVLYKFRANKNSDYQPDLHNHKVELLWWLPPFLVIVGLAALTYKYAHKLDPYKSIASSNKPINVEVVGLRWKWLFIYPDYNIATVNFLEFPEKTPLHFDLTSDGPMNLFWIPQLGGQMSAMAGMSTQLNLLANGAGEYQGSASEINGVGFAGMRFPAKSVSQADFEAWVKSVKQSSLALTQSAYDKLAEPGENTSATFYSSVQKNLYNDVMMKYMAPESSAANGTIMEMGGM